MSSWEKHCNRSQVSRAWRGTVKATYQTPSTSFSITFTVPKRGHHTATPRDGTAVQGETHDPEGGRKGGDISLGDASRRVSIGRVASCPTARHHTLLTHEILVLWW
jgi:hypothetical protein